MQYAFDIGDARRQAANYAFQCLILDRYCSRSSGELPLGNKQLHDVTIASGYIYCIILIFNIRLNNSLMHTYANWQ